MKLLSVILFLLISCVFLNCVGKGVVVGNPKPDGKIVKVIPNDGDESYVVTFLDSSEASVARITTSSLQSAMRTKAALQPRGMTVLEELTVPFTVSGNEATVRVSFSNGKNVEIKIEFTETLEVTAVDLFINGNLVGSTFSESVQIPQCPLSVSFDSSASLDCFDLYKISGREFGSLDKVESESFPGSFIDSFQFQNGKMILHFKPINSGLTKFGGNGFPILAQTLPQGDFTASLTIASGLPNKDTEMMGLLVGTLDLSDVFGAIAMQESQSKSLSSLSYLDGIATAANNKRIPYDLEHADLKVKRVGNTYLVFYRNANGAYTNIVSEFRSDDADSLSPGKEAFLIIMAQPNNSDGTFSPILESLSFTAP